MIGGQLDHPQISGENHFPRLRYRTLKFAFDRTQIKNDASHIYIYIYIYKYIYIKESKIICIYNTHKVVVVAFFTVYPRVDFIIPRVDESI